MTLSRLLRIARQRLRSISRASRLDAEVERELAFHVDQLVQEKTAQGLSPEDARAEARRLIGNVAVLKEQCRDGRRVNWLQDARLDVVYGLRTLARTPGFTAVVVASLALGIGANTAVLGVMDAVLRADLPLPQAGRLVVVRSAPVDNPSQTSGVSLAEYLAWRERNVSFDAMDLSLTGPRDLRAEEGGAPLERITGQSVTTGLFGLLGVQPAIGRVFTEADVRAGDRVIISHRLWQRRYAGDPGILNRQIHIDRIRRTIIGVMPEDFRYGDPRVDCWTPFSVDPKSASGAGRFFGLTARLKPATTVEQARADLSAIAARLAREFPDRHGGQTVRVQSIRDALFGWAREPLITIQAAVTLVLLIACANVAALLLARASARGREIAMRAALGAGRARIIRQLLTESVLLSLAGGLLGLLVAWWGVRGLTAMGPPFGSPGLAEMSVDLRILGLTGLLSVMTGLAFGLAPALTASRLGSIGSPANARVASGPRRRPALKTVLVAAQLALALILLTGSGLLLNSFLRLTGRNLNFEPAGLLTLEFRSPVPQRRLGQHKGVPHFEMTATPWQTMERVYERLRVLPGAESVAGISYPPVDSLILPIMDVSIDGRPATAGGDRPQFRAAYFLVTPNFFHTMRTAFVRGRDVSQADTVSRPWVAIVNEAAARRFWPGEDPIGHRLTLHVVPEELPREVIGIVRDVPVRHGQIEPQPIVYASYLQQPSRYAGPYGGMFGQMTFVLRHATDPLSLAAPARQAIAEIEPDRPIGTVMTAGQRLGFGAQNRRYKVQLVGFLACTATLLAAVGVYGLLAYLVGGCTREIGIRKALGAGTRDVVLFVGRHAVGAVLAGVIAGWAGALALTRLIASQLWGITPRDPATYAWVSVLLVSVALLACVGPTRRAIAVDPTSALRRE